MTKLDFLLELEKKLSGLPQEEIDERLNFYSEMIDDRVEEGITEGEAVAEIGAANMVASQIIADIPLTRLVKEKINPKKRLGVMTIILLILGSPIWLSLLIAAIAVILSLYISFWSVIVSLWAVFASFIGCAIGSFAAGTVYCFGGNISSAIVMIGVGIACIGLSIFMFYGCKLSTKGIILLTKKLGLAIKSCFLRKEAA